MIIGHEDFLLSFAKLADRGEISHGYIFWGPERVGKKTVALELARYLEEKKFSESDILKNKGSILGDCRVVSPDETKKIGIDAARDIKYFLWQKPNRSEYRTVVIDDAHLLTAEAQDALLKIAENPPASTLLIVIVRNPELLTPTLNSRLQKIYFAPVGEEKIREWLIKEFHLAAAKSTEIAKCSLNTPGRAYALLYDEKFQKIRDAARAFLKVSRSERKNFIKELLLDDAFNFEEFLDALIAERVEAKNFGDWHDLLALRKNAAYVNLNPRLHLEALFSK
ncbi:MAG: AAA family ATPase [Patescibacteria group bacterium]